jgi:hypothetical protein
MKYCYLDSMLHRFEGSDFLAERVPGFSRIAEHPNFSHWFCFIVVMVENILQSIKNLSW